MTNTITIQDKDDSEEWEGDIVLYAKGHGQLLYSDGLKWMLRTFADVEMQASVRGQYNQAATSTHGQEAVAGRFRAEARSAAALTLCNATGVHAQGIAYGSLYAQTVNALYAEAIANAEARLRAESKARAEAERRLKEEAQLKINATERLIAETAERTRSLAEAAEAVEFAKAEAQEQVKSYIVAMAEAQERMKILAEESVQAEAKAQSEREARVQAEEKATSNDAALSEADDTYSRATTDIKYVYSVGRVTGQARAAYPSYILEGFQATGGGLAGTAFSPASAPNAKQLAVIMKARALREKEEALIVNGDASTTATEYSGIVTLQSTTNKVDKNTAAVTYDDVETAIEYAFTDSGRPNLAVSSSTVLADLRKIMIDTFHYRPADMTMQLPFGVSSHLVLETMMGPVPVIPSQNLSNTSGSKSIYFLDMNYIEMRVLQDMTYEDLAHTNDSEKFMLKIYEALIMKNSAFNSWIGEIS